MENLKSQQKSSFISAVPTPVAGLMLAFATAGNMVKSTSETLRWIFGAVAFVIFILLIIKAVRNFSTIKAEFENVAIASVMPTFSMGTMVISTYITAFSRPAATVLWYVGVALHIFFIIIFTKKYVVGFSSEKVLPSWYIVYVGIVVATVTGNMFNPAIGKASFYFGFISYIVLIPVVLNKVYRLKDIKKPALPSKAIMTAPGSLCLAGYLGGIQDKNTAMILFLLIISQIFFVVVLCELPGILKLGFYPSFSALTFPTVIAAHSMKLYSKFTAQAGSPSAIIGCIASVEQVIAIVLCIYVLLRYIAFINKNRINAQ